MISNVHTIFKSSSLLTPSCHSLESQYTCFSFQNPHISDAPFAIWMYRVVKGFPIIFCVLSTASITLLDISKSIRKVLFESICQKTLWQLGCCSKSKYFYLKLCYAHPFASIGKLKATTIRLGKQPASCRRGIFLATMKENRERFKS